MIPFHAVVVAAPAKYATSWHPGCPVARSALRLITMSYRGFDGRAHEGRLVVSVRVAPGVVKVFRTLCEGGYPIRRMVPIDAYGNDDDRSLAADNTAGFNCRNVAGTSRWSMHASGEAIDINPVDLTQSRLATRISDSEIHYVPLSCKKTQFTGEETEKVSDASGAKSLPPLEKADAADASLPSTQGKVSALD